MMRQWDRQKGESEIAYAAFTAYRDLGAERSLSAVRQMYGEESAGKRQQERWSTRWQWVERCRAWDIHLQSERDRASLAHERRWIERREVAREAQYADAQALRAKVQKMLDFPLARSKGKGKDGEPIVMEPARWNLFTATKMIRLYADLEAEAIGQPVAPTPEVQPAATANPQQAAIAARMIRAGLEAAAELSGKPLDEPPPE